MTSSKADIFYYTMLSKRSNLVMKNILKSAKS